MRGIKGSNDMLEGDIKAKPTKTDVRDTKRLLADFLIIADIPTFDTVGDLHRWQHTQIITALK